eukprot:1666545-Amphidinium_carterae.1
MMLGDAVAIGEIASSWQLRQHAVPVRAEVMTFCVRTGEHKTRVIAAFVGLGMFAVVRSTTVSSAECKELCA